MLLQLMDRTYDHPSTQENHPSADRRQETTFRNSRPDQCLCNQPDAAGITFFGMRVGAATLASQATNALLGYFLYSKYTFYHVSFNKSQSSLRYGVMFMALWLCNWGGIHSLSMLGITKNAGALLMIAPLACISYLTQKSWIFIEK